MKETPLLCPDDATVCSILDGSKTQLRRPIKPQPHVGAQMLMCRVNGSVAEMAAPDAPIWEDITDNVRWNCHYGRPGDRLWVREAWLGDQECMFYRADGSLLHLNRALQASVKWRHGRYMPRWASRITLEITSLKPERLQAMSEADFEAEGVESVEAFIRQWNALHAERGFPWSANPWVWAVTFKQIKL